MLPAKFVVVEYPVPLPTSTRDFRVRIALVYSSTRGSITVARVGVTPGQTTPTTTRVEPGQAVYLENSDAGSTGDITFPAGAAGLLLLGKEDLPKDGADNAALSVVVAFHNDSSQPGKAQLTILPSYVLPPDSTPPTVQELKAFAETLNTDLDDLDVPVGQCFTCHVLIRPVLV